MDPHGTFEKSVAAATADLEKALAAKPAG
jgi:hypothetical protein